MKSHSKLNLTHNGQCFIMTNLQWCTWAISHPLRRGGFHLHHFQTIRVEDPRPPQPKFTALAMACNKQGGPAFHCRHQVHPQGEGTCQQCCQQTCCRHSWSTSQPVWANIYARSASREAMEVLAKVKAQAWCGELVRIKTTFLPSLPTQLRSWVCKALIFTQFIPNGCFSFQQKWVRHCSQRWLV